MRAHFVKVLAIVFVGVGSAHGQMSQYPATRTIALQEVEARSGPTMQYHPTSKLRYGDQVVVIRESQSQAGWLAIKPPPGSFSWIQAKNVLQVDAQTGVVKEDGATIRPGSWLTSQTPNTESAKLNYGFQVVVVGKPQTVDGENWLPIKTVGSEYRYIPASAVTERFAVAPGQNLPGNQSMFGPAPDANYLFNQAEQAYLSGNYTTAQQLYRQILEQSPDMNQRQQAQARLTQLQQRNNNFAGGTQWQPAPGTFTNNVPNSNNPFATVPNAVKPASAGAGAWTDWGVLRAAGFRTRDGQTVYRLESTTRGVQYVVPKTDFSLQDFVGRQVALFGVSSMNYDNNPPVNLLVASHVATP